MASPEPGDLDRLLDSWELSLRSAQRSDRTVRNYLDSGRQFLAYLRAHRLPTTVEEITRRHVEGFLVELSERVGTSTVATRYRCLQQLFRFLVDDDEIAESPMRNMRPPSVPEPVVPVLTDDEIRLLFKACDGRDFTSRRDRALVMFLLDSGVRRAECCALTVGDVDVRLGRAIVRKGKGGAGRSVTFGTRTARALDQYLRSRARHRDAANASLWLGVRGPLGDSGVAQIVRKRGEQAGIKGLRPHMFRHNFASAWLAGGGNESDLQSLAGWSSPQMVKRYASATAAERAHDAHRRIGIVDRL